LETVDIVSLLGPAPKKEYTKRGTLKIAKAEFEKEEFRKVLTDF
jgi:hypothetical protein